MELYKLAALLSRQTLGCKSINLLKSCLKPKIKQRPQYPPKFPMFDITIKDMAGNILCNIKEPNELSLEYLAVIIKNKCNTQDSFMLLYKDGKPLCVHNHIRYDIANPKHVNFFKNFFKYYILCDGITELKLVKSPNIYGGTNIPTNIPTYGKSVTIYTPHRILEHFNLNILKRLFGSNNSIIKDYIKDPSRTIRSRCMLQYWSLYKITKYFYNKIDTFIWDNIHINYVNILDEYGNLTTHNLNAIIQDLLKDLPEYFGINICKQNGYLKILTLTQLQEYFQYEKKHIDIDRESPVIFH
jgi:hypothetical protein